jgi:NADH:ubiquinone oxidoreductase subunit 5 (subunit L)/multisubunit Na+/H+ antiporter MnhA subunit
MSELLVVTVVVAAAGVGLAINVLAVRRSHADHDGQVHAEGLSVSDLALPLLTLVALLLAFVLVQTFTSFEDASESTSEEASAVLVEGESATLLEPAAATSVIGVLQCYARAVAGPGWRALEATRETSAISEQASVRVQEALQQALSADVDRDVVIRMLDAEELRIQSRDRRLAEARPTVPAPVFALLVVSVAILVSGTAALINRRMRLAIAVPVLLATVVIFAGALAVIVDLDRPFGGLATIEPDELRDVERQLGELIAPAQPPCDDDGVATSD